MKCKLKKITLDKGIPILVYYLVNSNKNIFWRCFMEVFKHLGEYENEKKLKWI